MSVTQCQIFLHLSELFFQLEEVLRCISDLSDYSDTVVKHNNTFLLFKKEKLFKLLLRNLSIYQLVNFNNNNNNK